MDSGASAASASRPGAREFAAGLAWHMAHDAVNTASPSGAWPRAVAGSSEQNRRAANPNAVRMCMAERRLAPGGFRALGARADGSRSDAATGAYSGRADNSLTQMGNPTAA